MLVAGRYRIVSRLGRGGMGEVWRGVDEVLGRPVAVKLLLNQRADEAAIARFDLEARTAAQLSHPHVVAVYDTGTDLERHYLVTEFLDGRSLAEELDARGPLLPARVAAIGGQVADALAAAHGQGVVHRDVKPGNLLLAPDGTVKVGDFGIAHFTDESTAGLTLKGQIIGTSAYLAPERAVGQPAGPPADMYALGCVLYELLLGHPPFRAETPAAMLYQHVDAVPDSPNRHRSDLPKAFAAFVMQLLAKYPEARPTAAEAVEFLASPEQWSAGQPPSGEFTPPVAGVPGRSATAVNQGAVRQKEPGILRSLRSRVATGSLVAAVAAAAVVSLSAAPPVAEEGRGKPHLSTTARPSPTHGTVSATQPPPAAATATPSLPGPAPKAEKASAHDNTASTDKSSSPSEKPTPTKKPKPSEKPTATRTPSPTSTPTPTVSSPSTPSPTQPEEPSAQ
ncbi:serine/threonine protein kinase [Streptomyces sp. NBC_01799]|uniref:serine/threonine-protein kinase n=1 Tax=Streptomyces sp. NBC_01800 TaxID=2975945 RepID=UPI002DDB5908|nr:serine/threonine-protein kinase [Streptomyces sp. NBC_01800]WSA72588.1 serine/threonine protein kinase [Streptomyces sp. NBC_01800]WSA81113.1 serine/threonine protein kinase [Streptomyces sp. NBC_01799]